MAQMVFSLLATVISFLCILLLRICWRKLGGRYSFLRCLSWCGIFLSTVFWIKSHGAEFGLVYSASVLALFAWCVIYADSCWKNIKLENKNKVDDKDKNKDKSNKKKEKKIPTSQVLSKSETRNIWLNRLWLFVLCGPFTLVAMCLLSVFMCFLIPVDNSVRLVIAAFSYPLFIGLCVYWLCAKKALLRHTLVLSVISVVSAISLYAFTL